MQQATSYNKPRGNKALFGLIIIVIGIGILLKQLGLFPFFNIRSTWPIVLIAIGLVVGLQKKFTNNAWWILMLIGGVNLIPYFTFNVGDKLVESDDLVVPAFLIVGGLVMILKPRKNKACYPNQQFNTIDSSYLNTDVVFGGRKEIVTSKDFKGGSVSATFGGCEVNLLQADTTGPGMELQVRSTFGGIEIIVPSGWEVKNEIETIFGSVEDHRSIRMHENSESKKLLVLKGTCVFGGVEIKSI